MLYPDWDKKQQVILITQNSQGIKWGNYLIQENGYISSLCLAISGHSQVAVNGNYFGGVKNISTVFTDMDYSLISVKKGQTIHAVINCVNTPTYIDQNRVEVYFIPFKR